MSWSYNRSMAMGTRKKRQRQEELWYGGELPTAPGHPFYKRLNEVLDNAGFDAVCEASCAGFYHNKLGRPSLPPGQYFRVMMIGFFEGLDSERGIAWRLADSLTLRQFLSIGLDENTPDHVTISRTRRLIDGEIHQRIFTWVLERLAQAGLIKGKTIGVDSTTLEANAAMKSIVRRDTGESYMAYLKRLAEAEGIEAKDAAALLRMDRKRKKKTSNADWKNPNDEEAEITKLKDGRTALAYKAENAVAPPIRHCRAKGSCPCRLSPDTQPGTALLCRPRPVSPSAPPPRREQRCQSQHRSPSSSQWRIRKCTPRRSWNRTANRASRRDGSNGNPAPSPRTPPAPRSGSR